MARNLDNPMGLQIWGVLRRATLYAIQTAPTIAFYHGDPVQHGGTILSTATGHRTIVEDGGIIAASDRILGGVVAVFDKDMDPLAYMPVGTVGDSTVAGYLMVADHPEQEFVIQEDAETTPIPKDSAEMNTDFIIVALNAGDTGTGLSSAEIDSSDTATTLGLHLRLHYPHPDDTVPATATYHTRWIVTINAHQLAMGTLAKVTLT